MNTKQISLLSIIFLIFISLSYVSATENNTIDNSFDTSRGSSIQSPTNDDLIEENTVNVRKNSLKSTKGDALIQDNRVSVTEGNSIQSAIDNAVSGSTIIVEKGNYSEDLIVSKKLSIIGQNAMLNSNKVAFNILSTANNTSISGFNIHITDTNGTGIIVNASSCKIADNNISGGNIGIMADMLISNSSGEIKVDMVSDISVLRNNISNMTEAGILIKAFNPTVTHNNVTNITNTRENGTAMGIQVAGNGIVSEDLTVIVTDNNISNIKASKNSSYGLDVAGNSIFDTMTDFNVFNNIISNIVSSVEAIGANIGIFSLESTVPTIDVHDMNISNISSNKSENSTVTGLAISITTIGQNESSDEIVQDVNITNLTASGKNSTVTGIDATGVGCVNIHIVNTSVSNFNASESATGIITKGIDYTNFNIITNVSSNNISNITSSKVKGINVLSFGNATLNQNVLHNLSGNNSTFITAVPLVIKGDRINITIPQNATFEEILEFLKELESLLNETNFTLEGNLSMYGNNLEGTGVETAFAVVMPSLIKYNRVIDFNYNVLKDSTRSFLLESNGLDPSRSSEELAYQLIKSQQQFENCTEEELRNMSASLGVFLDKIFGNFNNLTQGDVDARYNWWGTNSKPDTTKFSSINGEIMYNPWLTLRAKSNPQKIYYGQYSSIGADTYLDSSGFDHSFNNSLFFSGRKIILSTDKGSFKNKKSIILNWTNGKTTTYLKGDEIGLATIGAYDYATSFTNVLIFGKKYDDAGGNDLKRYVNSLKTMDEAEESGMLFINVTINTKNKDSDENYLALLVAGVIASFSAVGVYIGRIK